MARGSISEVAPNKWRIKLDLGKDSSGKRLQTSKIVHGGRRTAEKSLAEMIKNQDKTKAKHSGSLRDFLTKWLEWKASSLSPKTIRGYSDSIKRIPEPILKKPIGTLSPRTIDALYLQLEKSGASPYVIRQVHSTLRSAFSTAVKWELVDSNPFTKASPPALPKTKLKSPNPIEVADIVKAANDKYGKPMAAYLALAAILGTRRGELLALRRSDVDFSAGTLRISKSVLYVPEFGVVVKTTKTGEERKVSLDAMAKTILEDRMADLRAAVDAGFEVVEDPYIFASDPTGAAPWHPDWPTHAFAAICKSLEIEFHLHQLRHFTATQLIAAGVDIRTVSGRLGHSDPTVTLRVYSHVVESADLRATEIMSGLLNTNKSANSLKST